MESHKKLVAAIIAQAVDDYKSFVEKGWIVGNKIMLPTWCESHKKTKNKKARGILARRANCEEIIHFFKPGGMMDKWVDLADLAISPDQIRHNIGVKY